MAPVEATIALSHQEGITDSARARELYKYVPPYLTDVSQHSWGCFHNTDKALCRYYQPNAPINADTCFPAPPPAPEDDEPTRDLKVKSEVTSSKISSPDTALTAFCQLTTWRTGAQRAMIRLVTRHQVWEHSNCLQRH
jgi:hypothetical protein